jgi:hypothetical protein
MYTGHTNTIERDTKRHNELHAIVEIVVANPDNLYWQARLANVRDQVNWAALEQLVEVCLTDPEHIINTQAEVDDWLQSDNARAAFGEDWIAEAKAQEADWLDEQQTQEDARY